MLHELCHVHAVLEVQVDDAVLDDIHSDLLSCAPDSARARHMKAEQAAVICLDTFSQDNGHWQHERKLRITASRCRAYFTFIPKENRPDGVVEANGGPSVLIEIKSPEQGEITAAKYLIAAKMMKYVVKKGENYHLREKHPHYSQCQLGMFLLDLKAAHLMVYCKKGSEIIPDVPDALFGVRSHRRLFGVGAGLSCTLTDRRRDGMVPCLSLFKVGDHTFGSDNVQKRMFTF
ncbi:hypothetical protein HPB47_011507 [Ixodes persulcatus]|uniref:Uncharacterized protein n=1 Tax=Ixodes persulcatus TaxID=34615 RepID=A0AC60NW93_IXOPE|nr:hypothetical protein HPB47_011507 [Ixodes persulcatus]